MSTVIRDAIIRVKLEQQKSALEAGGEKKWAEGYKEAARSAEEFKKSQQEAGQVQCLFAGYECCCQGTRAKL